jgi:5-methylcytosine-specific restriction enzyme A
VSFNHGLSIGKGYSTYYIQELFKHNRYKGMRYSLTTNTLVLISDHYSSPYEDEWKNGLLHYTGSGLIGDQKLTRENKNLVEAEDKNTEVFLFEIFDDSAEKYIFKGRVELVGAPYQKKQYDKKNNLRLVWVFPLNPLDADHPAFILPDEVVRKAFRSSEKKRMLNSLNEDELKKRAELVSGTSSSRTVTSKIYIRNQYVSDFAKRRAKGICDLCETPAPFSTKDGEPYLESHHIVWLSNGGEDTIENTVALCPNCHRLMHALDKKEDKIKLQNKIKIYSKQ